MNVKFIKQVAPYVLSALLALPLTLILTFILSPFWNWFEGVSGIESLGHSEPADWCYVVIYIALVFIFAIGHGTRKSKV